jgi:hypothetical protein
MIMPPAVFSSAGAGFTITLSASGVTFNFFAIVVFIFCLMEMIGPQFCGAVKVNEFWAKPQRQVIFTDLLKCPGVIPQMSANFSGR